MALYYTAHLEWFQKYLGGEAPSWTTEQFLRNAVFDRASGQRVAEVPATTTGSTKPVDASKQEGQTKNPQGKTDAKPKTP
jgi:alpha-amylase/alpha-mannosidase (GH57 family)